MLNISRLDLAYSSGEPVLQDVDLKVGAGEFVSLIGPSGCGKSTLLRLVMGLQKPTSGQIKTAVDQSSIGFLFQEDALLPWRTARSNIALGLRAHGMARQQALAKADEWLDSVGLNGLGNRYPGQLSGGQRKRVSIAQVLALHPRLLLMDEPFASLDAIVRRYITEDLLGWVQQEGITVLMVTHDLDEAVAVSDRVVLMTNGPRARIKAEHNVPLPIRMDRTHARKHPEAARLVSVLWDSLSQEIHIPRPKPQRMGNAA